MASLAQLNANRTNAQLSTGPRTAEGKQTSSQNAVRHGMTSSAVVLPHENAAEYEAIREGFLTTYAPANDLERALTVAVAETWWRLQRQRRIETALMDQRLKAICETNPDFTIDMALATLMSDPAEMKRMNLMPRYVNSAERAHTKAVTELKQIQKLRRENESQSEIDAELDARFAAMAERMRRNETNPNAPAASLPIVDFSARPTHRNEQD